jgi:hypothetical protein
MFLRHKFVTNSSNTSFVGFGVWLESEELLLLGLSLIKGADQKKVKKALWIKDDEEFKRFSDNPQDYLTENSGDLTELIGSLLPVSVESPGYYGGAYLHVDMPEIDMNFETGEVKVKGSEQILENGRKLQKALREAGLPSELGVVSDCWRDG